MSCLLFKKHLSKIPKYYFSIMFKHTDLTPIGQEKMIIFQILPILHLLMLHQSFQC